MDKIYLYGDITPEGVRAIFEAMINSKFKQLKDIRIWKVSCKDEGVRMLCKFLQKDETVTIVDVMEKWNNLTRL